MSLFGFDPRHMSVPTYDPRQCSCGIFFGNGPEQCAGSYSNFGWKYLGGKYCCKCVERHHPNWTHECGNGLLVGFDGNACHICKARREESERLAREEAHREESEPNFSGKEWIMYHGTDLASAIQIKQAGVHGLKPSSSGMLGAGVYCSRELQKAQAYAPRQKPGPGVVFLLRVRPGKVKTIRSIPDPLQKTWHRAGYDTAWVPPGCVNASGLEEDCVWDPQRVQIVGVAWSNCGFTW
jgi:hypothetical protein